MPDDGRNRRTEAGALERGGIQAEMSRIRTAASAGDLGAVGGVLVVHGLMRLYFAAGLYRHRARLGPMTRAVAW